MHEGLWSKWFYDTQRTYKEHKKDDIIMMNIKMTLMDIRWWPFVKWKSNRIEGYKKQTERSTRDIVDICSHFLGKTTYKWSSHKNLFSYLDNGVIPLELAPLEAPDSAAPELERRVLEEDCNTEEEVEEEEDDWSFFPQAPNAGTGLAASALCVGKKCECEKHKKL